MLRKSIFDRLGQPSVVQLANPNPHLPTVRLGYHTVPGVLIRSSGRLVVVVPQVVGSRIVDAWADEAGSSSEARASTKRAFDKYLRVRLDSPAFSTTGEQGYEFAPMNEIQWSSFVNRRRLSDDRSMSIEEVNSIVDPNGVREGDVFVAPMPSATRYNSANSSIPTFPFSPSVGSVASEFPFTVELGQVEQYFSDAGELAAPMSRSQFGGQPPGRLAPLEIDELLRFLLGPDKVAPMAVDRIIGENELPNTPLILDESAFLSEVISVKAGRSLKLGQRKPSAPSSFIRGIIDAAVPGGMPDVGALVSCLTVANGVVGMLNAAIQNEVDALVLLDRSGRPLRYMASYYERALSRRGVDVQNFPRTYSIDSDAILTIPDERRQAVLAERYAGLAPDGTRVMIVDDRMSTGFGINTAADELKQAFPAATFVGASVLQMAPPWHSGSGVYGVRAGVLESNDGPGTACLVHDPHPERQPDWVKAFHAKDHPMPTEGIPFPTPRHVKEAPGTDQVRLDTQRGEHIKFLGELRFVALAMERSTSVSSELCLRPDAATPATPPSRGLDL